MTLGEDTDLPNYLLFKLNVTHIDSEDCQQHIVKVWNRVPRPRVANGWILWWEAMIKHTIKFLYGCGRMVTKTRQRKEKQASPEG